MNVVLISAAASLGVFHTAIGVDHYIPFAAMGKANGWSFKKTMLIVLICGIGHVLGSVILGLCGIFLGTQLSYLVGVEDFRGEIATWFLIAFGLVYMLWGIRNAVKNKPHSHVRSDGSEIWHDHHHIEHGSGVGSAEDALHTKIGASRSFWPLFVLLVLGPCEPLIPLLIYPAAESGMLAVATVALVFSLCTIATMLACTAIVLKGINMLPMKRVERYSHALAGFAVLMSGLAIIMFGI